MGPTGRIIGRLDNSSSDQQPIPERDGRLGRKVRSGMAPSAFASIDAF